MKSRILAALFALSIQPVLAGEQIEGASATLAAIELDPVKAQAYCDIILGAPEGSDDVAMEETQVKLEEYFKSLGPEYEALFQLGDEVADDSEEAKILDAAFDRLEARCATDTANQK
jgi:hypothetical protein